MCPVQREEPWRTLFRRSGPALLTSTSVETLGSDLGTSLQLSLAVLVIGGGANPRSSAERFDAPIPTGVGELLQLLIRSVFDGNECVVRLSRRADEFVELAL